MTATSNPLLADSALPDFALIRPEHIEPAIRELLGRCRARLAEIAALDQPTFADVVVPLEVLRHRLARAWSPVSHLYQSFMRDGDQTYLAHITMEGSQSEHEDELGQITLHEHAIHRDPARRAAGGDAVQGGPHDHPHPGQHHADVRDPRARRRTAR